MKTYTKEALILALNEIKNRGWIPNARPGNAGGVGNTLEYFHYNHLSILQGFSIDNFLEALIQGNIFVDFDARTGHNHGTKFRLRQSALPQLYSDSRVIF